MQLTSISIAIAKIDNNESFILTIFFGAKLHTSLIFAYTSIMGVITIFSEYVLYESLIVAKIAHLTHEI